MKITSNNQICLLLDDSRISGISIYSKNLAKYIKKNFSIKCEIILPKLNSSKFIVQLKNNKIPYKFYDIERISSNTIISYLNFFLFKKKNIINFFRRNTYSTYIIQGSLQYINILILNYLKKKQIIIIHDSHMHFLLRLILKLIVKKETKIIFVSNKSYDFYKDIFKNNIKMILPTGSELKKKIKKNKIKKSLRIGVSCNINPDKNIFFLLDVAKVLKKLNPSISIEVAGNIYKSQKNYFNMIKYKIKKDKLNNVKFLGFKKNINKFLKRLDLYCCFSKTESSPLAIWEAMHIGLPIITTDVGDLKYHINRGKFGYVIDNNDKIYAMTIIKVLSDKNIYEKFSNAAFSYSRKNFNLDKNFKNLMSFIFSNKNEIDNKKIKLSIGNLNRG